MPVDEVSIKTGASPCEGDDRSSFDRRKLRRENVSAGFGPRRTLDALSLVPDDQDELPSKGLALFRYSATMAGPVAAHHLRQPMN